MKQMREAALRYFDAEIYGKVEGWLGDRMSQMVSIFGSIMDQRQVHGHIAEFGIHHGLFLFLLSALRDHDEKCFAIDVFDNQSLNIDHSGGGSLKIFNSYLESLMVAHREAFRVIQRDTLSFSIPEIVGLFDKRGVKFLSIDAGHTVQHAINDLLLAQEILVPGGIAALDDYMSVHWPGVAEGFYRFMLAGNRRLRPFLIFQNKLFLTTISEHPSVLQAFRAEIGAIYPEEIRSGRWKEVEVVGAACLAFA